MDDAPVIPTVDLSQYFDEDEIRALDLDFGNAVPAYLDPFVDLSKYATEQEATEIIRRIQAIAMDQGFAVRKENSSKNNFSVVCTRGGTHRATHQYINTVGRIRSKSAAGTTRKTGCLWKLYVSRIPTNDNSWRIAVRESAHNHPLETSPYDFHQHRKLTESERGLALSTLAAKAPPVAVIEMLHRKAADEKRLCYVSLQEIYNLQAEQRSLAHRGRTPADAIVRELVWTGIPHRYRTDSQNELKGVFFANPMGIILAKYYGHVLFMDATYKTNKYGMPLLHIIAASPTNQSFTVALCFLSGELEEDYLWAMHCVKSVCGELPTEIVLTDQCVALRNALRRVFPTWKQQLCRWHLAQNLTKNYRAKMDLEDFDRVLAAYHSLVLDPSENSFHYNMEEYSRVFLGDAKTKLCWLYVQDQMKEGKYFLAHALSRTRNFEETSTSRIESFHRALKGTIQGATADLFSGVTACLAHGRQTHRNIFKEHATDSIKIENDFPESMVEVISARTFPQRVFPH